MRRRAHPSRATTIPRSKLNKSKRFVGEQILFCWRVVCKTDRRGNIATVFALASLPVVAAVGTAVDYSNANAARTTMQMALPGLSVLANYVRAVRYPDGAIVNGTGAAETGYTTAASVKPGDIIALFGTGFGPTSSSPAAGTVFSGAYQSNNPVTVTVGGIPAQVLWAGLVGPGLNQINIVVPNVAAGDQAVVATVLGASTQTSGALLKVASA